jgi:hypothetical protein
MWNAETLREEPYDVSVAVKGMPLETPAHGAS